MGAFFYDGLAASHGTDMAQGAVLEVWCTVSFPRLQRNYIFLFIKHAYDGTR